MTGNRARSSFGLRHFLRFEPKSHLTCERILTFALPREDDSFHIRYPIFMFETQSWRPFTTLVKPEHFMRGANGGITGSAFKSCFFEKGESTGEARERDKRCCRMVKTLGLELASEEANRNQTYVDIYQCGFARGEYESSPRLCTK